MPRADANGSFYVTKGGFEYTGIDGADENQIVTYDSELNAITATNLDDLVGGACVSQYTDDAPTTRPSTKVKDKPPLEIGDFWTQKGSRLLHIWDGENWDRVLTINGNPVGTTILTVITAPLAPPPAGYLACDGTPCPPEFNALTQVLLENTGSTDLPNLGPGYFIKH